DRDDEQPVRRPSSPAKSSQKHEQGKCHEAGVAVAAVAARQLIVQRFSLVEPELVLVGRRGHGLIVSQTGRVSDPRAHGTNEGGQAWGRPRPAQGQAPGAGVLVTLCYSTNIFSYVSFADSGLKHSRNSVISGAVGSIWCAQAR